MATHHTIINHISKTLDVVFIEVRVITIIVIIVEIILTPQVALPVKEVREVCLLVIVIQSLATEPPSSILEERDGDLGHPTGECSLVRPTEDGKLTKYSCLWEAIKVEKYTHPLKISPLPPFIFYFFYFDGFPVWTY